MSNLTLGSLFDGSGGFPLGGALCGINPVWASEIEPFPIRVTTKKLPQVTHLGDIHNIHGGEIAPVDIITFGSPCTNLSIAGKREGLQGEQSSLFYEAIRIIKEMKEATNGKYPRYAIWENVMGAFSSNQGEDFRAVLESFTKINDETTHIPKPIKWAKSGCILGDNFSIAYRSLDAQYFGVPQRRKRIYLVADFNGTSASEILFECQSLSRDTEQSENSREETTSITRDCTTNPSEQLVFENHSQDSRYTQLDDVSPTVSATYGTGGNNQPFVVCAKDSNSMKSSNPHSGFYQTDTSRTIDMNGGNPSCNQGGVAVVSVQGSMIGRKDENGPNGSGINEDVSFTLNTTDKHAVVYVIDRESFNCGSGFARSPGISEDGVNSTITSNGPSAVGVPTYSMTTGSFMQINEEKSPTLAARDYKDPPVINDISPYGFYPQMKAECVTFSKERANCLVNGTNPGFQNGVLDVNYIVRRLTPTECARLQGFPDDWCSGLETENPTEEDIEFWTKVFANYNKAIGKTSKPKSRNQVIKWLENPHSDTAEYKMWGNGVALPCVVFVLERLALVHEKEDTN